MRDQVGMKAVHVQINGECYCVTKELTRTAYQMFKATDTSLQLRVPLGEGVVGTSA